jgi:hypothetical protein
MKEYAVSLLIHVMARLDFVKEDAVHHREHREPNQRIADWPPTKRIELQNLLREALPWLDKLSLGTTKVLFEQLIADLERIGVEGAIAKADSIRSALEAELKGQTFFVLPLEDVSYYNNTSPVSEEFASKWPIANIELSEAGNCRAFGRYKACVYHCCLAYESGLTALGRKLKIPKQNDWGGWIRSVRDELKKRYTPKNSKSREFYAQCAETFDALRVGKRNLVSHVNLEAHYTEERAKEILEASRNFMRQISTKLKE